MIIDTGLGWSCDDSYLCTESGLVGSVSGRGYYKTNSVAAIVIFCRSGNYWQPMFLSTDESAISFGADSGGPWTHNTTFTYLGYNWYFNPGDHGFSGSPSIVTNYPIITDLTYTPQTATEVGTEILRRASVITVPFYNIIFNSNGGSGSMSSQAAEMDTYVTLDLCSFTREDYTFIGWSTSSSGYVMYTDGDTVYNLASAYSSVTLYAVWRKNPPYLIIQENKSEIISLTKDVTDILQTVFTLKDETSIIDPVFVINCPLDSLFRANYITVPSLGRKYFIQDIASMTNDLVELTCHVDVLSTYADEIKANKGIVHRQENNWNLYLNDGVLQVYQNPIITTQAFPDGFKENNFVLVTAGTRGLKGVDIGEGGEVDIENDLGAGNNESRTTGGLSWYAQQQVGKPYWYGTFGNIASADLFNYKKIQYPSYYTATDFPSQYGQKVHDCVGIIKGYRWGTYPYTAEPTYVPEQDVDVRGLYNQCIRYRGDIARSPLGDIITDLYEGCCVFYGDMTHVGVYIGNDQVAEAKSHADGVVITDIKQRTGFTLWGVPDWIKITTTYL